MIRRRPIPRRERPDLLTRPPVRGELATHTWAEMALDPVAPLVALADLRSRGLLSPHEFERQKAKVINPGPGADPIGPGSRTCDAPRPRPPHARPPRACGRWSSGGT